MSLLIKGINVKEIEHGAVAIINIDDVAYFVHGDNIVVISDHGDLIDRDELMTRLGMAMDCEDCPNRTALYFCGLPREVMEVCDELENAPVVIPAERRASLCICDNCDKRNDKGCSVCKYINERSEDGEN